jgi:CDP-diacylglycerol--serine O-phosphatidyltransferase
MMTHPAHAFHQRNALTYVGLMLGCGAVSAALSHYAAIAGALVALAVIADTFDGRFSRLFSTRGIEPAVGVQLDSLCDGCTFGMAPVVCTAALAVQTHAGALVWMAGCIYVTSALTRLAFFNVTHDGIQGFVGIPAPVAALIWSTALCFTSSPFTLAIVLLATAVGMISAVRIPRPVGAWLGVFALWPVLVVAGHVISGNR